MKIFLTSGTGFIGKPLTQALISRGWNVVALVRKSNSPQVRALAEKGRQLMRRRVTWG